MNGMTSSAQNRAKADRIDFQDAVMGVHLVDGRVLNIPLDWYPRLERATPAQRKHYTFFWDGELIEWPEIDEHISVEGLLRGNKAPRTQAYLTGKFSEKVERERKRIEASYRAKKSLPSKRAKRSIAKSAR